MALHQPPLITTQNIERWLTPCFGCKEGVEDVFSCRRCKKTVCVDCVATMDISFVGDRGQMFKNVCCRRCVECHRCERKSSTVAKKQCPKCDKWTCDDCLVIREDSMESSECINCSVLACSGAFTKTFEQHMMDVWGFQKRVVSN